MMSSIKLSRVSKHFTHYDHMTDRLREIFTGKPHHHQRVVLRPLSLEISPGEVVGIIGRNGAGKSTLLKLVAGMLQPSAGEVDVQGRIGALLELGGGFHREMSGRENVFLACTILGFSRPQIEALYPEIVDFAGLGPFMDEAVKTYSSGMFMRLAFAVATCIDPDILIVDEALSVGDGAFARKSFDRIMHFKRSGKTILFCSHSLYQVEAICTRVLWLDQGSVRAIGNPATVTAAYNAFLDEAAAAANHEPHRTTQNPADTKPTAAPSQAQEGTARITGVEASSEDQSGSHLELISGRSELTIKVLFASDPNLPTPTVAVGFLKPDGMLVASAISRNDQVTLERDSGGNGTAMVTFPAFPLLKGTYYVTVYLACENAVHPYEISEAALTLEVKQDGLEQGVVTIPHMWCGMDD